MEEDDDFTMGSLMPKYLNKSDSIYQIVFFISKKEDYSSAAKVLITQRLKIGYLFYSKMVSKMQIAKLVDTIINKG
ncbi:hypothetical protein CRV00_13860 [Malaciobacter molluscorum]|uniref:hypothetical protein n=1 Tax=Malaciobacter molluscorum TaxID=1032072 RepID=UPI00100C0023|nr:hypothetical protein [Malaciobacter molluscorum]RXJ91402.1 hypothetical protein CRV00_13860 [Malaciobacter molluscorum]